eukprot:Pgem_evm1s213
MRYSNFTPSMQSRQSNENEFHNKVKYWEKKDDPLFRNCDHSKLKKTNNSSFCTEIEGPLVINRKCNPFNNKLIVKQHHHETTHADTYSPLYNKQREIETSFHHKVKYWEVSQDLLFNNVAHNKKEPQIFSTPAQRSKEITGENYNHRVKYWEIESENFKVHIPPTQPKNTFISPFLKEKLLAERRLYQPTKAWEKNHFVIS